jgi:hypothetical protein
MRPSELQDYLTRLIEAGLDMSVMLWGPPGVGKSSIVQAVAAAHGLACIDLRLSQLAPTDLRGLPVPDGSRSRWLPPEFLPEGGRGVLFLDEINMAPPALQGVAQQLILDRRVGSYQLPDGWFVWAAGNRKEDRAAVFDMPAPLANRFIHLEVEPAIDDFRAYAFRQGIDERVIGFLSFRSDLLHKYASGQLAWPSPRSWVMADRLLKAGLSLAPAIGEAPAAEFQAFCELAANTPDLEAIVSGMSQPAFPAEPSVRYATVMGLVARTDSAPRAVAAVAWLVAKARPEWVQLFAADLLPLLRERGHMAKFQKAVMADAALKDFLMEFTRLALS